MPTPVARLVGSSEASLTTTVPPAKDTRWLWLIWPVPMRSLPVTSRSRPSTPLSHPLVISPGVWIRLIAGGS